MILLVLKSILFLNVIYLKDIDFIKELNLK